MSLGLGREKKGIVAHTQKIQHANNTIVSVKKPTKKIICNSFNARLRLIFQNSIAIMVLYDFFYTLSFPTLLRLYYVANMVVTSSTESSAYNFLKL